MKETTKDIDISISRIADRLRGRSPRPLGRHSFFSVMIPLCRGAGGELSLLFEVRSSKLRHQPGDICFPGGKIEESDPDKQSAALRECQEEIGVSPQHINIVSTLSDIYIPLSNFNITPYVGTIPKMPNFVLSPNEVDEVIPVSLQQILDDRNKTIRTIFRNNHEIKARGYQIGENFIWGATAMIIAELETLLKHEV